MKELGRVLIHDRNILNCRVSFKMLLSMCFVIELLRKNFEHSCDQVTFRMAVVEVALIQVSFLNVYSKQKKNKMNSGIPWHLHTIQNLVLLKKWFSC